MNADAVADHLEELAILLELQGENPFKIRAYRRGADALRELGSDSLKKHLEEESLGELPGFGEALVEKIRLLAKDQMPPLLERLRRETPPGLMELLEVQGLGTKKIAALRDQLGIDSAASLEEACQQGKVAALKGFGKKTEDKLLEALIHRKQWSARHLRPNVEKMAESFRQWLSVGEAKVKQLEIAGSFRRGLETSGDLDILVESDEPPSTIERFLQHPEKTVLLAEGETKVSIRIKSGLQVDLRVVSAEAFPFALHYFTGSKDHNVTMRRIAQKKGYRLSEYGLEPVENNSTPPPPIASEADLFSFLGMAYIPPTLREGMGECEAAMESQLPSLIQESDLKGTFHCHTSASDGRDTLEKMAEEASRKGWEYLGISDHSKASFQANGLNEKKVLEQKEAIEKINASGKYKTHLLSGVECDILKDGSLDLSDECLGQLDFVVASIHNPLNGDQKTMTDRLIKAIRHPAVTILGHPTGRLLLRREGYPVDWDTLFSVAAEEGVVIELNCSPMRMELDWRLWKKAAAKGILCSINTDAHSHNHLSWISGGVLAAQKGWLTPNQVLNSLSLNEVKKQLRMRRN